jgi:excisionase family DNA binding protein
MDNFYTARQVQELLKVDRITVYRMLQDGRLKGVKIGQQWRFPKREVERLLSGECIPDGTDSSEASPVFPVHCVQTIQTLFSDVSQISALVLDDDGAAVTHISRPCEFCQLIQANPAGLKACQDSWRALALQRQKSASQYFTCHAGLQYIVSPVFDNGEVAGFFLAGEFYWQVPALAEEKERVQNLAAVYGLPVEDLLNSARNIPVISQEQHTQVTAWTASAAGAVQSILRERAGFIQRLQKIADLTQIS